MADATLDPAVGLERALALVDELLALVATLREDAPSEPEPAGLPAEDMRAAFRAARLAPPRRVPGLLP